MKKKVLLISEYLNPPFDEGIKKTVFNLFKELENKYFLQVICRKAFLKENIHIINTNRLFISIDIKKIINDFKPDVLIYFPFASSTFAGYLRFSILSNYYKNAKTILIALQPKRLNLWQKCIIRFIRPNIALTPSPELSYFWSSINIRNLLLPLITDVNIFKPVTEDHIKRNLRQKYNIPEFDLVISHMGHLNDGRNLKSLIPLQKSGYQVVVVGSSSTPKDAFGQLSLKEELRQAGIIILERYIEHIEEIYQLSDIYIFPVIEKNSSIGLPLSILEARACGIPVITTNFGSIKTFLETDFDNIYYSQPDNFCSVVNKIQKKASENRLNTKVQKLNEQYMQIIHQSIN